MIIVLRIRNFAYLAMLTLASAFLSTALGHAQNGPIKILVGLPPGGAVDIAARLVGEKLQASLAEPVLVENKPGANADRPASREGLGAERPDAPRGARCGRHPLSACIQGARLRSVQRPDADFADPALELRLRCSTGFAGK